MRRSCMIDPEQFMIGQSPWLGIKMRSSMLVRIDMNVPTIHVTYRSQVRASHVAPGGTCMVLRRQWWSSGQAQRGCDWTKTCMVLRDRHTVVYSMIHHNMFVIQHVLSDHLEVKGWIPAPSLCESKTWLSLVALSDLRRHHEAKSWCGYFGMLSMTMRDSV